MQCFSRKRRRGAAAVELAVVAPVLILLIFGIIEFGRAIMAQQVLTNASREGARRAIVESATNEEVTALVKEYLAKASVSGATVTVSPNPLSSAGMGDPVTVVVSVPCDKVSWMPPWLLKGRALSATTLMRADRYE